jgi:hypothetical protein
MCFWNRVKILIESKNTTWRWLAISILKKSETTISGWRSTKVLPRADDAVKIASALNTTVEFMVTGTEPAFLPAGEIIFYRKALKWRIVIEDLEILSPAVANGFCNMIRAAAKESIGIKKEMGAAPHAENQ